MKLVWTRAARDDRKSIRVYIAVDNPNAALDPDDVLSKEAARLVGLPVLRDAMTALNVTRDEFAERIGGTRRRIDNWLLPADSKGFREMDEMAWKFVREILTHERKTA